MGKVFVYATEPTHVFCYPAAKHYRKNSHCGPHAFPMNKVEVQLVDDFLSVIEVSSNIVAPPLVYSLNW